jgi:hypothetical protein
MTAMVAAAMTPIKRCLNFFAPELLAAIDSKGASFIRCRI